MYIWHFNLLLLITMNCIYKTKHSATFIPNCSLYLTGWYHNSVNIRTNLLFVSWQVYGNKITVCCPQCGWLCCVMRGYIHVLNSDEYRYIFMNKLAIITRMCVASFTRRSSALWTYLDERLGTRLGVLGKAYYVSSMACMFNTLFVKVIYFTEVTNIYPAWPWFIYTIKYMLLVVALFKQYSCCSGFITLSKK